MRKTIVENIDLIAIHPGQYIGELIEDYNMTQKEFAEKLGLSPKTISKLVNGEELINNDIAQKLAKFTNISMKTWLNLQASYDRKVAEGAVPWE
ncbi:HigA family addiction module antitoxin [Streptococcus parasanguinis]|jgi:addiction module antidote protein HigA|nr:HigA family addiction module antidote protein [Streptococcus parasanguinis]